MFCSCSGKTQPVMTAVKEIQWKYNSKFTNSDGNVKELSYMTQEWLSSKSLLNKT